MRLGEATRMSRGSDQNGAICCVSYLCAELYSGAWLLFLSCGLGAGSLHRTLPLPALILSPLSLFTSTAPLHFHSLGTPEVSQLHTHAHMHTFINTHTHSCCVWKALGLVVWISDIPQNFLSGAHRPFPQPSLYHI